MTRTDKKTTPAPVLRPDSVVAGINRILHEASSARSEEQLGRICLAVLEDVTQAGIAFISDRPGATAQLELIVSDRARATFSEGDAEDAKTDVSIGKIHDAVLRDGRSVITNAPIEAPAGLPAFRSFLGVPLRSGDGTAGMIGLGNREGGFRQIDLDAVESLRPAILHVLQSKRAEVAHRDSERRLKNLVDGVPQLIWRAFDGGEWNWAGPQWTAYTGQAEVDSHGFGWLDPLHPQDRDGARTIWRHAMGRGEFEAEYRIGHLDEHRYRWFRTRATAVRNESGEIVEWLGTSTDIDDLRALQGRQQILVGELQHRVRNILTVVRSVFARTIEGDTPIDDRIDHFKGRLDSLARTQVIMTQYGSGTIDLDELVREELLSVGAQEGPCISIGGPDVALPSVAAESLGLALHELTMNAVKYGALKVPGATLDVRWRLDRGDGGQRLLVLTWTEQDVPAIAVEPAHSGFGKELIERALPYRLGAETKLEFRGGGVRCSIAIPLPREDMLEQAKAGA